MNLHGIVARSGQAFKYILDPDVDLMSPSQAAQLAEAKRQLTEVQRKLDESEKVSREKDTLIAQLREQLAAKAQPAQSVPTPNTRTSRRRKADKRTQPQAKNADAHAKPTQARKKTRPRKAKPTAPAAKRAAVKGKTAEGPKRSGSSEKN
jgi:hypothetical protein